jgi:hypothetical protein
MDHALNANVWMGPTNYAANTIDLVRLVQDVGGDLDQVLSKDWSRRFDGEIKPEQVQKLISVAEYIEAHTHAGWSTVVCSLGRVYSPTESNWTVLRTCLQRKLSPDIGFFTRPDPSGVQVPLLFNALWNLCRTKEIRNEFEQLEETKDPRLWCIAALLIQHGANIHWIDPEDYHKALNWRELRTLWDCARSWNVEFEWFRALEKNGIDVDLYRWADIRRLRGATRSGIDEGVLDLPSVSGLRCRPCRRKYCKKHDRGIFDPFDDKSEDESEDE